MSNRVSPEPVPFSADDNSHHEGPTQIVGRNHDENRPSIAFHLQQISQPPPSDDSEYQPRIESQESAENVEPAATYDPPDVGSARTAKRHGEDWAGAWGEEADEKIGKSGGREAEEHNSSSSSSHGRLHKSSYGDQQEEEEETIEDEEEKNRNTQDLNSQSRINAGAAGVVVVDEGGVSGASDFPISESNTSSFDDNSPSRVLRPVGRLPPLGQADDLEETQSLGRVTDSITSVPKMSARPNSGINRKDDQDGIIGANDSQEESGCCAIILTALSYILVILFFPFSLCLTIKVVQEYERAVIFRLGRLLPGGAKGPGIFFVMPCIEEYTKVDLRTVSFDVPPQEVLTRDSVTVSVDAVVYYRISNPTVSVANVENAANSTQLLAQTTLRNVLGTQNLAEILSNREHISEQMQNVLDDATDKWGIKVERVEIKDVRLPTQLQRAMAAEAEAARDARAKVIAAEGEQKASIALKEAADIISDSPAALQLRYLQTLNSISAEKNSTIIFPLPIEMVAGLVRK